MRFLLIIGLVMLIAIGVSEVSASSDMCKANLDDFQGGDVNQGIDLSKHYRPEYFDILIDNISHLFSDISNAISGLFNH